MRGGNVPPPTWETCPAMPPPSPGPGPRPLPLPTSPQQDSPTPEPYPVPFDGILNTLVSEPICSCWLRLICGAIEVSSSASLGASWRISTVLGVICCTLDFGALAASMLDRETNSAPTYPTVPFGASTINQCSS